MDSLSTEEMCFMMESLSLDEHQPGLMPPQEEAQQDHPVLSSNDTEDADWKADREKYRNKLYRLIYTDEEEQRREEERQAEKWLDEEEEQRANDETLNDSMAKARNREHAILGKMDEGWSNVSEPTKEEEEQFQRIKHDIEMLLQEQLDDIEKMRQQLRDQQQKLQQQQDDENEHQHHYDRLDEIILEE